MNKDEAADVKRPDWLNRMFKERQELEERMLKLHDFLKKIELGEIAMSSMRTDLLSSQLSAMQAYYDILSMRIDIECKELQNEKDN